MLDDDALRNAVDCDVAAEQFSRMSAKNRGEIAQDLVLNTARPRPPT